MRNVANDLWLRAEDALRAARHVLPVSPDTATSRAYYAAFYAVSAFFALDGRTFTKHAAVETAVHRDLVKAGVWPMELGEGYSRLTQARIVGDYGLGQHASPTEAADAIRIAESIVQAVSRLRPGAFPHSGTG